MKHDILYQLLWLSRPLMQQVETAVETTLEGTGVTVRTRAVMEILHRDGPCPVPELARRLHIQRQYVQIMVNEALAAGLVYKQSNPRHARSSLIALTTEGHALIQKVLAAERSLLTDLAEALPQDDIATALRVCQQAFSYFDTLNSKG